MEVVQSLTLVPSPDTNGNGNCQIPNLLAQGLMVEALSGAKSPLCSVQAIDVGVTWNGGQGLAAMLRARTLGWEPTSQNCQINVWVDERILKGNGMQSSK
jgi:hypothetical protein